jgi:Na+/H+ antiporter NhaA
MARWIYAIAILAIAVILFMADTTTQDITGAIILMGAFPLWKCIRKSIRHETISDIVDFTGETGACQYTSEYDPVEQGHR